MNSDIPAEVKTANLGKNTGKKDEAEPRNTENAGTKSDNGRYTCRDSKCGKLK